MISKLNNQDVMNGAANNVTINDVAKAAGVSKGTVDRVIHNRGEVSEKSRKKVLKVIEELGYKPNVYASMLASQKKHTICCIIPEYTDGDFWSLTAKGIEDARESALRYGVNVEIVTYDQYDLESFRESCLKALDINPSGVVVAPIFRGETLAFAQELSRRDIPYVYIDSKIDEDEGYLAYFGMPMFQSGYMCADMLMNGADAEKVYIIRIERDKTKQSDPTAARRTGFIKYMCEHFPDTELVNVLIDPKDREARIEKLDSTLLSDKGKKLIVMFNSRIHLVADYVRTRNLRNTRIVGFDFLEKNVEALKEGIVQAIVAQHSDRQAASAVMSLVDKLIIGTDPNRRDNFTQLDILNRYNCDYYM